MNEIITLVTGDWCPKNFVDCEVVSGDLNNPDVPVVVRVTDEEIKRSFGTDCNLWYAFQQGGENRLLAYPIR